MAKRITTNELGKRIDGLSTTVGDLSTTVGDLSTTVGDLSTTVGDLSTTVNDLVIITKQGFDDQGKRIDDLALMTKMGFTEQGKQISALQTDVVSLKDEVAKNGDAVAVLTNRFDAESAATIYRLDRVDRRLDRIEGRLSLAPTPEL